MEDEIKISVIVPIYQVENYVKKCIQSICVQTYRNLEIILVDDCSKDRSGVICDECAKEDARIMVIHQSQNGGPSMARNIGMKQATGDYYLFVDGDDWIDETLCEHAITALKNNYRDADTVHWGYDRVDEEGKKISENQAILYPKNRITEADIFDEFINTFTVSLDDLRHWLLSKQSYYEAIHSKKQMATVWRYLFSAQVIKEYNLCFPEQVDRGEDIVFLLYYLQKSKGVINLLGKFYYHYLNRSNSLMKEQSTTQRQISLLEEMEKTLQFTPKEKQEEMRHKWQGQRILIVMNKARKQARYAHFWGGIKSFVKSQNIQLM